MRMHSLQAKRWFAIEDRKLESAAGHGQTPGHRDSPVRLRREASPLPLTRSTVYCFYRTSQLRNSSLQPQPPGYCRDSTAILHAIPVVFFNRTRRPHPKPWQPHHEYPFSPPTATSVRHTTRGKRANHGGLRNGTNSKKVPQNPERGTLRLPPLSPPDNPVRGAGRGWKRSQPPPDTSRKTRQMAWRRAASGVCVT